MNDAADIKNFHVDVNNSTSYKFKQKIIGVTAAGGTIDVEIMVPLKYLSNFWRTLEIPLINCETNLVLTWSEKCVLSNDTKVITFAITNTTFYVPVVYQLTIMQNCLNNYNLVLKEQLTGININQNQHYWHKTTN